LTELNPDHAEAYNQRGLAYLANGAHDRAIADFDRAVQLDPENLYARRNRDAACRASSKRAGAG
jgi:lipoprotein NlpI